MEEKSDDNSWMSNSEEVEKERDVLERQLRSVSDEYMQGNEQNSMKLNLIVHFNR